MKDCYLWWSSGKDSAWTLHRLRQEQTYRVCGLVTSINAAAQRVAMHGVRRSLLEAQARAVGLPLHIIELPAPCSNQAYEDAVQPLLEQAVAAGIEAMAFGDLFLEDIREYRCRLLQPWPLQPVFPLWGEPTATLARTMQEAGLRAKISCLDLRRLPATWAGAEFDAEFLAALPQEVDPCGENGEFHSFAWAGPMFSQPIPVHTGVSLEQDGFLFCDLVAAAA